MTRAITTHQSMSRCRVCPLSRITKIIFAESAETSCWKTASFAANVAPRSKSCDRCPKKTRSALCPCERLCEKSIFQGKAPFGVLFCAPKGSCRECIYAFRGGGIGDGGTDPFPTKALPIPVCRAGSACGQSRDCLSGGIRYASHFTRFVPGVKCSNFRLSGGRCPLTTSRLTVGWYSQHISLRPVRSRG